MDAGCGSIWNKNSWHWEEKNYTPQAKQFLQARLAQIKVKEGALGQEVSLYEVKSLEGSASISIRKQKLIQLFEFEAQMYFKAELNGEVMCQGAIKINEVIAVADLRMQFNQDEDDVDITVTCEKVTEHSTAAKKALTQGEVKAEVLKAIAELKSELKKHEANEERLKKDAEERERASKEYAEAQEKAGDTKMKIFEEQKAKEAAMKEKTQELLRQQQQAQPQQVAKPVKVEGSGSVWNTNSYFWEEKSVGKWADEQLKSVLGSFKFESAMGGKLLVTEVKSFKGESSISIRKGKKIVSFDYAVKLKWEFEICDGDGNSLGKMIGEFELPEISNDVMDDGEEWEVRVSFGEDKANLKARLEQVVRKDCVKALRTVIKEQFVEELKKK